MRYTLDQAARRAQMQHALTRPYWVDLTNRYACELAYRGAGIKEWTERDYSHVVDTLFRLRWQSQIVRLAG